MDRLKLTIAYIGSGFHGWQVQPRGRTVQLVLEEAVAKVAGCFCRIKGAARTDAGVHALGQVAHVDVPETRRAVPWRKALNGLLPKEVSVVRAEYVEPSFHSRFSAISKTYAYRLWLSREWVLPQVRPYVAVFGNLDLPAMEVATELFVGGIDFASFMNVGTPVKSTVRTVSSFSGAPGCHELEYVFRITADGFLKQMVRNIMGTVIEAGRGKVSLQDVRSIIERKDRTRAPFTAPAQGLCLERVRYPEEPRGQDRRLSAQHQPDNASQGESGHGEPFPHQDS